MRALKGGLAGGLVGGAILAAILVGITVPGAHAQRGAEAARIARVLNEGITAAVESDIREGKLPGAVVLVSKDGGTVFRKAFGSRALAPVREPMTPDAIFDAASLTKVVATATSVMILVERGQVRLADNVGRFIPELEEDAAKRITVLQLLTHTSGYAPDFDLREKWTGRDGMMRALVKEKLRNPPGARFVYSDIGFIVLGEIIQRVTGKGVGRFFADEVASKLRMKDSGFRALTDRGESVAPAGPRIAPTENVRGQRNYLGSQFEGADAEGDEILRGKVHDPTAFRMNGVAGHAGLFSTADDLARFCQMILNGGTLGGVRILSPATVAKMTSPQVVSEDGLSRGLGFDLNTSFSTNRGDIFPLGSFGHTGFTGTSIWIDPASRSFAVFLSNRVHPDGKGDVGPLRGRVNTIAASAVSDGTGVRRAVQEAEYNAAVAAQLPRFKESLEALRRSGALFDSRPPATVEVLNGIDVLEKNGFKELKGLRLGLVTNHTGRNLAGKPTIDVLKEEEGVNLVALFSPEHGIRGELDQEKINDSKDEKTGLPIYSLYGETRRPKPEQLASLDAVVFDIQDIGARFYTYMSTLRNVMEEAAKAGKPVFVLDRPNPINGIDVEGPLADAERLSFVATHTIPVRHGMTIGELALMFNKERSIAADVRVVKMENWSRALWFDQAGQTWINPSPNMRSLTQATLYPGIGLIEFTNVSVGRGTDTPFEVVGAPWIDGRRLASWLNSRGLPGVRFVPIRFTPSSSVHKGTECGGVNLVITDRRQFKPVRTGVELAVGLRRLFPTDWKPDRYIGLLVNSEFFARVLKADEPAEMERDWKVQSDAFSRRRAQFLLYR
jgi:uncharacterized protein YbbC (DUF1343 family)/CubicO group peptidase (beta-lactamase class C family)